MKTIDSIWFTNATTGSFSVGIVLAFCPKMKYFCAYIGHGISHTQEQDECEILKLGSKLTKEQAAGFFGGIRHKEIGKKFEVSFYTIKENYKKF